VADTPLRAFDLIDIAEKAASIYLICKNAGFTPQGISDEQLAELESRFPLKQR
jgi:ribulose-5-phosphate 4-epimerase/fuculose-1-phosphate aldolase